MAHRDDRYNVLFSFLWASISHLLEVDARPSNVLPRHTKPSRIYTQQQRNHIVLNV